MFPLILAALLLSYTPPQDVRVAVWTTGTPDTETFESFAFWIKSDKRAYIRYLHGTSTDDIELSWRGPGTVSGRRGFWASFPSPDSRTVFITPANDSTLLIAIHGHNKKYYWENENAHPESDCDICAADATEATGWLRRYFWN
jgi:hypothetical protein